MPKPPKWFNPDDIPQQLRDAVEVLCDHMGLGKAGVKIVPMERYALRSEADKVRLDMGEVGFTVFRVPGKDPVVWPTPDGPGTYELDSELIDGALSTEAYPVVIDHYEILIPGLNAVALSKN